jgi:hypothetical protein
MAVAKKVRRTVHKARPPFPLTMPGTFFVLEYANGRYSVYVDDAEGSSYNGGSDVVKFKGQLRSWNLGELLQDAIDTVQRYRRAQVIPSKQLVLPLFNRQSKPVLKFEGESDDHGNQFTNPNL